MVGGSPSVTLNAALADSEFHKLTVTFDLATEPGRHEYAKGHSSQLGDTAIIGPTFRSARSWELSSVAVMIAQVPGGPTVAVLMVNVPLSLPGIAAYGAAVTLRGTVTPGWVLLSWTVRGRSGCKWDGSATSTTPDDEAPPTTELGDKDSDTCE
jgi:hypothetical protein